MKLTLRIWRQHDTDAPGGMVGYEIDGISPDMSFLEMLDTLNERLTVEGEAARKDEEFSYAAAWEFTGTGEAPTLHKEDLVFEYVHPTQRSYA